MKKADTFTAGKKKKAGIYPYILLDVNGEKVAVFGLTTEDTSVTSSPGKSIVFHDAFQSAQDTVKEIQNNEHVNKIIALTHIGHQRDLDLAKKVKGIDLIVGGHTHTLVDKMEVVKNEEPTIVAQAKEYGEYLGRVDVAFDKNGIVLPEQSSLQALPVNEQTKEDPDLKKELDPFKKELVSVKNEKVGSTKVALDGQREHVRSKETNLGNFIADGMLQKAKEAAGAQIAITNGGGIRAGIDVRSPSVISLIWRLGSPDCSRKSAVFVRSFSTKPILGPRSSTSEDGSSISRILNVSVSNERASSHPSASKTDLPEKMSASASLSEESRV